MLRWHRKDLRKRENASAMKKSSTTASEGLVALSQNKGKDNCETDFVSDPSLYKQQKLN